MPRKPLTDAHRKQLNDYLRDLQNIEEELKPAIDAGIPNADEYRQRCLTCREQIGNIKKAYFPTKQ